jgi:hypothetical protein
MDPAIVRHELVKVLEQIQAASGLACPVLTAQTKPIDDLPDFDSKMWPVAIGLLAKALGVVIADDVNIFRHDHSTTALTLDETIAKVMLLAKTPTLPSPLEVQA